MNETATQPARGPAPQPRNRAGDERDTPGVYLRDEFVAVVSHELRTPLTVLLGYLEMLQRRLLPSGDDVSLRYASRALSQTRRLADLIGNLLDVTRFEHGKMQLELEPIDLVPLVAQAVDIGRSLSDGQSIDLDIGAAPIEVRGDAGRIEQVVMNLLTNAIKYAPETDRIDVRLCADDRDALLEVHDYGPGIPAADLPNLFSRFYQVADAPRRGTGLGLGLYISSEIVRAHGGTIEVRSVEGKAATFTVRIPLLDPARG